MSPPEKPKPHGGGTLPARRDGRRSRLDAGFDRWLDRQLHQIYDPVLGESIPPDLNDLLDAFERKPAAKDGKPDSEDGQG